jgi:hypothetical protein
MPAEQYLTIKFSGAQLTQPLQERAHDVAELHQYLKGQGVSGADRLKIMCSADFFQRADPKRAGLQESVGAVPIQEAIYALTGDIISFPDFTEAQKLSIGMLGFETRVTDRPRPTLFG